VKLKVQDPEKTATGFKAKMRIEDFFEVAETLEAGCAWNGCKNTYLMKDGLPDGWVYFLVWDDKGSTTRSIGEVAMGSGCKRDACLCPDHANEFMHVHLKPID